MFFWLIAIALTLIVALALLQPFWRSGAGLAEPAAAYDLRVYRDQLAEVDRDLKRGILDAADAERLRTEIGRKILDADRALSRQLTTPRAVARHAAAPALILLALSVLAVGLYLRLGVPGLPDMGLSTRIAQSEASYASRPSQQEAEARLAESAGMPALTPPADPQFVDLIEKLRQAVAQRPDDPQGLALLARNEARLGNLAAARRAQQHLIEVLGPNASAADHAFLAGLMTEAAGGVITPETEAVIARALQADPRDPQALYMTGLLQIQNGRPDRAFPIWRDLLEASPPDTPWAVAIRGMIRDVAWLAGQPDYVPPATEATGPDSEQVQAASELSAEDRQQMIQGMVSQLEDRLSAEGGPAEDWARLITSLAVLGEQDRARAIHAEALTRFKDRPDDLATIEAAGRQAGIAG